MKARAFYGRAVQDGVLRYSSPSGLDKADTAQPDGCVRRWWYRYVKGIKEEQSKAAAEGDKYHEQIAYYLTTGQDMLAAVPRSAMHHIPTPGPDLCVEWALAPAAPDAVPNERGLIHVDPRSSVLYIAGLPIIGWVDLGHARGTNKGTTEILEAHDPPGTLEILDWKFTGDLDKKLKYTTADQVASATPMIAYGHGMALASERSGWSPSQLRLSHVYISTGKREPSRKVSKLVPRDEVGLRWEARAGVARSIQDAARETDPERVEANTRACDAYGRACPYKPQCTAGMHGSLHKMFNYGKEMTKMGSVLDILKQPAPQNGTAGASGYYPPATGGTALPPNIAPLTPAQGVGVAINIPAPAPPPPVPAIDPRFGDAWAFLERAGYGYPSLSGAAANALSTIKGWQVPPGTAHNGTGQLAQIKVSDPADVIRVADQLNAKIQEMQRPAPAPILPPDAPPSQPHLAALPVQPTPQEIAAGTFPPIQQPPPAPGSVVAPAPSAPSTPVPIAPMPVQTAPVEAPAPEPKKRGRPKKDASTPAQAAPIATAGAAGLEVYVDAVPNCEYTDLASVLDDWAAELANAFKAEDIRCAGEDTPIGYSKWRGGWAAYVDAKVRDGALPAGSYVLFARRNEIYEVAAAALRRRCDLFVRGV